MPTCIASPCRGRFSLALWPLLSHVRPFSQDSGGVRLGKIVLTGVVLSSQASEGDCAEVRRAADQDPRLPSSRRRGESLRPRTPPRPLVVLGPDAASRGSVTAHGPQRPSQQPQGSAASCEVPVSQNPELSPGRGHLPMGHGLGQPSSSEKGRLPLRK